MSKIILNKVYLLNWYGFVDKTIPIGKSLSLITGENECGKSTVLDAIKYAFTGDTDFNKATSATRVGVGRRTLSSYTRCLIDPDTRKYARPANTHPNVFTHIALEYYNELYDSRFVLGVILETNSSDNVDNYWYSLENKTLDDIYFFNESDSKKYVLSAKQFRDKNRVELLNKNNGVVKFMTMTGLKLQGEGITKYQRKLKSIMTYNPEAKIQQFIKESVLEDRNINLNKLKEAKEGIDSITVSFEILEKEIKDLDEILIEFEKYSRVCSRLIKDDVKKVYKELLNANRIIDVNTKNINDNVFEIERLTGLLKQELIEKEEKEVELRNSQRQLEQMDGTKAVQDEKDKLASLKAKADELKEKINVLKNLSVSMRDFIHSGLLDFELSDLLNLDIPSSIKNNELSDFKNKLNCVIDKINKKGYDLDTMLKGVQDQINSLDGIIKACERNLPDYSRVSNQLGLIKEINNRFKELGINSEAKFSSSFVVELKNEEWRDSIETFLGIHRYSILVEPEYFDIANEVMDSSQYRYVELVNTKLLSKKEFDLVDDSLLYKLEIRNETAKKYFAYWLGRIHAVDIKDVPNYENAISKEGKISRNMAVTFLNFKKLDSYCLGEDAVKLNKDRATKEKARLEKSERSILEEININNMHQTSAKNIWQIVNKDYDLEAPNKYSKNQIEIQECNARIRQLEDALKNNSEYLLLVERVTEIENKLEALNSSIEANKQGKYKLESNNDTLSANNSKLRIEADDFEKTITNYLTDYPNEVREAKEEYDLFVDGKRETGDVMIPQTRLRTNTEKVSCERSITNKQSVYNAGRGTDETLPVGLEYEAVYRKRKNRLQVDSFEEIKAKLASQTRKYESIFKNEFVLKIKTNIEDAQADIKDINRQLKKLQFSTTYQFDVKNVSGTSDYARILDYADYLKKTNNIDDGQIMITSVTGYDESEAEKREEEIKEIIDRVISKNNDDMLNNFADYRNYMEYEVIVNNDEITNGRLSKLAGYNSGAGTQIPYTIILSAALAIIYNARQNSTRLVFIDEPFEKMSDKNIKIMLDFFKTQEFQVIFCAPPNKLDSIGKECDAVIPIKKINKSNMTLGAIKFYE
ncbi:MAG: SbcC/MukB-like Walker B domain-containing protein [Erysipelotrichaceae bacterium]|nr:SbcC/MukB-like Walker B domain-containing protein [Erysipelotrichaceae bacterium]